MGPRAHVGGLWARIEGWFAAHRPELDLGLNPPATEAQLAAAEAALDVRFPDDLRASFLVHDGQADEPTVWFLPHAQRLGSLASIVACHQADREHFFDDPQRLDWLDGAARVRQVHLHPRQIPLAGSPYWDYDRLLVDFIPADAGRAGQIIARCDIDLVYLCDGFGDLLARIADGLDDGTYVVEPADAIGNPPSALCLTPRSKKPVAPSIYFSRASARRARSPRARPPRG